jgi:spore maturation protein CgeB
VKAYIPNYPSHAGHWIYKGYQLAWAKLGYDMTTIPSDQTIAMAVGAPCPNTNEQLKEDYIIMTIDALVNEQVLEAIDKSHKTFVFAQPNTFPQPWGSHPNFQCLVSDKVINSLNQMDNVYLWTFGDGNSHHTKWKKAHTIPLAFDSLSYKPIKDENYSKYDICFVGGWANNGFNEKRPIMIKYFSEFMKSGLNCGFFINKNISQEQENALLYNSKISLNIHDAYQRILGYDTNERTFKSLGLNGVLLSDKVDQLERIFPDVKTVMEPSEMVRITKEYLSLPEKELNDIKEENRQNILDNHCYTHRVEQLLSL